MLSSSFDVLRDPVTGERLIGQFPNSEKPGSFGLTGVLKGRSRDFPVLGGVVVFREDLATETVTKYAR